MPLLRHVAVAVVVVELLRITASCSETEIRVCTAPKDNIYGFINFKTQQQRADRRTAAAAVAAAAGNKVLSQAKAMKLCK